MTVHELKTIPPYFGHMASGLKTFEVRLTFDRTFAAGDTLLLREWVPDSDLTAGFYTGREARVLVTYLMTGPGMAVPEHLAVMAVKVLP